MAPGGISKPSFLLTLAAIVSRTCALSTASWQWYLSCLWAVASLDQDHFIAIDEKRVSTTFIEQHFWAQIVSYICMHALRS